MWEAASDAFVEELRGSHTPVGWIEVRSDTELVASSISSNPALFLPLLSASVTIDKRADRRRTLSASFVDGAATSLLPSQVRAPVVREWLDPLSGFNLHAYRGVRFGDGTIEGAPLGVFPVESIEFTVPESGAAAEVSVTAPDRSAVVARNKWRAPYSIASGTNYASALTAGLADRALGFSPRYNVMATTMTTSRFTFSPDDDPWSVFVGLGQAMGGDPKFGRVGEFECQPAKNPDLQPVVADWTEGAHGTRLAPISRKMDVASMRTGVIVRSSAPWLLYPVEGSAWDDDPLSPTWRGGRLGEVPEIVQNALVTNTVDAGNMAQALLYSYVGILEDVTLSVIPNPLLDEDDVGELAASRVGLSGKFSIDSTTIPVVGRDPQTIAMRYRRRF